MEGDDFYETLNMICPSDDTRIEKHRLPSRDPNFWILESRKILSDMGTVSSNFDQNNADFQKTASTLIVAGTKKDRY